MGFAPVNCEISFAATTEELDPALGGRNCESASAERPPIACYIGIYEHQNDENSSIPDQQGLRPRKSPTTIKPPQTSIG